ncbi:MAG: hypothetical protein ACJARD_001283 [Alphaproteobacteria bacterium]|jgi:hypothetical protein
MTKYGKVAEIAVIKYHDKIASTPLEAWEMAAHEIFSKSQSSRLKNCPKDAFLGLCENGKVKNIPAKAYTESVSNKGYALKALSLINENPALADDKNALWALVILDSDNTEKKHNAQMDVVISLFKKDFLVL